MLRRRWSTCIPSLIGASLGNRLRKRISMRPLPTVGLIEMGRLGEVAVRVVAANLQTLLDLPVEILEPAVMPRECFLTQRQQYDAGLIVKHLAQLPLSSHLRILGVTVFDLCLPILTYVYGEAEVGGRAAVISNFRLRQNEDGSTARPRNLLRTAGQSRCARSGAHPRSSSLRGCKMPDAFRGETQTLGPDTTAVL